MRLTLLSVVCSRIPGESVTQTTSTRKCYRFFCSFQVAHARAMGICFTNWCEKASCNVVEGCAWCPSVPGSTLACNCSSRVLQYLSTPRRSLRESPLVSFPPETWQWQLIGASKGQEPARECLRMQVWLSKSFGGNHSFTNAYRPLLGQTSC